MRKSKRFAAWLRRGIIPGTEAGEKCRRNGCRGWVHENPKRGCSCHINPPCSACMEMRAYCPKCGWDENEEWHQAEAKDRKSREEKPIKQWWNQFPTVDQLDRSKINWFPSSHTHFSMKKTGVFPPGTTRDQVRAEVDGTFGGRFESWNEIAGTFTFIAYTD